MLIHFLLYRRCFCVLLRLNVRLPFVWIMTHIQIAISRAISEKCAFLRWFVDKIARSMSMGRQWCHVKIVDWSIFAHLLRSQMGSLLFCFLCSLWPDNVHWSSYTFQHNEPLINSPNEKWLKKYTFPVICDLIVVSHRIHVKPHINRSFIVFAKPLMGLCISMHFRFIVSPLGASDWTINKLIEASVNLICECGFPFFRLQWCWTGRHLSS